ncbi:unnamed protein product, partial [Ectocarpus fasciculatus]
DEAYNRVHAGCLAASARLGDSTLAVVGLLHRGAAAAPSKEFRAVVLHLRMLAEKDLDSIDFFWPQVLHAFYLLVPTVTAEGVFKAELLEDFILGMALRSTHLALKLVWWLKGYVEDLAGESAATPGKGATGKQAHLVRLAVEVEDIVLARADEANSSISSRGKNHGRRRGSDREIAGGGGGGGGGGGSGGSGGGTDEKESGGGVCVGGVAAATTEAGASLAGEAGGASAVTRADGAPDAAAVEETAVAQPDGGRESSTFEQQPARPLDPVGKTGDGTTPANVGAPRIEKGGVPVEPAIERATSSPSIEPAARTAVAGGEEASCCGDGGSVNGGYSDGCSRAGGAGGDTREASPPFERRLLTTLVRPTGAQSSLVADELLLLRALRAAAAEQLGLDYVAKTRYTSWVDSGSGGEEEEEMGRGESEARRYFEDQLTFVQSLVDIAERLRFVEPVTARGEHLKRELRQLQKVGDNDYGGNAPEVVDGSLREDDGRAQEEVGCSSSSGSGRGDGGVCVSGSSSGRSIGEVHSGAAAAVGQGGDTAGSGSPAAGPASPQRKPSDAGKEIGHTAATAAAAAAAAAAVVDEKRVENSRCRDIDRRGDGAGVGVVGAAGSGGGGGGPRGFLPVCRATEPICPIVSIPPEEGHVFKTKQRAPTLITCEIIVPPARRRQDDGGGYEEEEEEGGESGGPESADPLPPLSPTALPAATAARRASNATGTGSAWPGNAGDGNGGGVALASGAGGALASPLALHGSGGSSGGGGGGGGGDAGGIGGVAVAREEGNVTRSRSLPLQRAVSGPGRGGGGGGGGVAPGGDGNLASPLRLQRRETSRGSEREEVEEMIESQIEGQGSLGRSIDNKDADGGSHRSGSGSFGGGGGGTGSGGLVPPTPPRAGAGYPWSTPQPQAPRLLLRTHSDPPLPRNGYGGGGSGAAAAAAAAERRGAPVRRLSLGVKAQSVPSRAGRGPLGDGGGGEGGVASLGDSAVHPEVLSALGLELGRPASLDGGARPATAPAVSAAGFVAPGREAFASAATPPMAGGHDGSGSGSVVGKGALSPPSLKNSSSSSGSKLSLIERQDLVLPEPVREEGRTGEEQASDVADVMLRSHGGHELLRHSPLGQKASGVGDDANRSARGWGEAEGGSSGGDVAADGNGDEGASSSSSSSRPTGAGDPGAGGEEGIPLGGGGGTVARDPQQADIEREVREQQRAGGVHTDGSSGVESGGGLQRKESLAVSQARELLQQGLISSEELEAVVQKDQAFTEVVEQHAFLDVQFCVGQAFGESWAGKRARIKAASERGSEAGWDLVSIIVKSNDDMRQEVCALQLIGLCQRIFAEARLDLFLEPYVIVSTGSSSGLVQCLTDAMSVDALKKNAGFFTLRDHFERTYGEPASNRFLEAQRNFVNSLAAYSLASYVLQIKDRHNGNILLDTEGRLIHIDFGFILGMAPGGNFALENCPFKLPTEYVDVMGGLESQ